VSIDREALIDAIDALHEATFETFRPEAHHLAKALGWDNGNKYTPTGEWLRERLDEALR
jgi:hypothetical protein